MPLSPSASIHDYIHGFVHSKHPKFAGKSKKERIKMALGAFYSPNESEIGVDAYRDVCHFYLCEGVAHLLKYGLVHAASRGMGVNLSSLYKLYSLRKNQTQRRPHSPAAIKTKPAGKPTKSATVPTRKADVPIKAASKHLAAVYAPPIKMDRKEFAKKYGGGLGVKRWAQQEQKEQKNLLDTIRERYE